MSLPDLSKRPLRPLAPDGLDNEIPDWPGYHRPDAVLLPAGAGESAVDEVNKFIENGPGYPGRLGTPLRAGTGPAVVPVIGGDALDLRDSVRSGRQAGNRVPEVRLVHRFRRATHFQLQMDRWGHGAFETFVLAPEQAPARPPWVRPPVARRPVIALLDSGVQPHPWLPPSFPAGSADQDSGFVIEDWQPDPPLPDPDLTKPYVRMAAAHATFIAGLIRLAAPDAQILSMRVMGDEGDVDEVNVVQALKTLKRYVVDEQRQIDVVCMAFGRPVADGDDNDLLEEIKTLLQDLSRAGVRIAASAGNDGSPVESYPAAFGQSAGVDSVGALDADGLRADFSDFGPWVRHWRVGSRVLSVVPGGGFARWSGTSFAVATYAGDAARVAV